MSAHVLPPLAVNSKSERKVNSLPPLGFKLVIFGMLAHLSNHSTKPHPQNERNCGAEGCKDKILKQVSEKKKRKVPKLYLINNAENEMLILESYDHIINPFTAEVAIMRLLGSALKSHLCDQRRRSNVTGLSDHMTLFIDLGCLYCKRTQRAFNAFKNTLNRLKIDSVHQKFN
jgi:hypothetical protein